MSATIFGQGNNQLLGNADHELYVVKTQPLLCKDKPTSTLECNVVGRPISSFMEMAILKSAVLVVAGRRWDGLSPPGWDLLLHNETT